ncbi:DeoR family transcriptional regulator [Spirochaetia bacterium]|nr:DeoR family transcriptional regulator [Spirochaetia bacterium]
MQHERRMDIVERIKRLKTVKVQDLMEQYQVSIETIRRDLEFLEERGHLQRVYGGAILQGYYSAAEPAYEYREQTNSREKQAIGKQAATLINDGDSLFIDYGTTTGEMVKHLGDRKNLTILTNAILIARELIQIAKKTEGWRVILLGGEIRDDEFTVSGTLAEANLKDFYVTKTFIGVGGISVEAGLTDYSLQDAGTHRLAIERANMVIGLADHSKFGVTTLNHICPADKLDILITDWLAPETVLEEYRTLGIQVLSVPEEE